MGGFVSRVTQAVTGYEEPKVQQVQQQAVKQEPKGPVTAAVDDYTTRKLASNRRGRRALILKSKTGVDENVTLGTKTLLG